MKKIDPWKERIKQIKDQWKIIEAYRRYQSFYINIVENTTTKEAVESLLFRCEYWELASPMLIVEKEGTIYLEEWEEIPESVKIEYPNYKTSDIIDLI